MTLDEFLRDYNYEDWYISTTTPKEMMHELAVKQHHYCLCSMIL